MLTKNPNAAHLAIAECEGRLSKQGREVTVITQNIDELHCRAGSKNILEIHGKYKTASAPNASTDRNCSSLVHVWGWHESPHQCVQFDFDFKDTID